MGFHSYAVVFLLLSIPSSWASNCFAGLQVKTSDPQLKAEIEFANKHFNVSEMTNCPGKCKVKLTELDYTEYGKGVAEVLIAGCGFYDCEKEGCFQELTRPNNVYTATKYCCCHGENCYSRNQLDVIFNFPFALKML